MPHDELRRDRTRPARRRLMARLAGWLAGSLGLLGFGAGWRARDARVRVVERDGWFLDARDR